MEIRENLKKTSVFTEESDFYSKEELRENVQYIIDIHLYMYKIK